MLMSFDPNESFLLETNIIHSMGESVISQLIDLVASQHLDPFAGYDQYIKVRRGDREAN